MMRRSAAETSSACVTDASAKRKSSARRDAARKRAGARIHDATARNAERQDCVEKNHFRNMTTAAMRHMVHLETDLYKQYLTFYSDQNFFSDRRTGWIKLSEWDGTYALTGVVDHVG